MQLRLQIREFIPYFHATLIFFYIWLASLYIHHISHGLKDYQRRKFEKKSCWIETHNKRRQSYLPKAPWLWKLCLYGLMTWSHLILWWRWISGSPLLSIRKAISGIIKEYYICDQKNTKNQGWKTLLASTISLITCENMILRE